LKVDSLFQSLAWREIGVLLKSCSLSEALVEVESFGGFSEKAHDRFGSCRFGSAGHVTKVANENHPVDAQIPIAIDKVLVYRFGWGY
jgi:hypothetical protein